MKRVFKSTSVALAIAASMAVSGAAMAEGAITAVSWGGAYTKSQLEAYHKPFTAKTGIKVNSEDYNGGLAQVKAQVESGNVTWDLVDVELSDAIRGCDEGLLESLPIDELPNGDDGSTAEADFLPNSVHECAVGTIVWSTVYAYDGDKFGDKGPKTLADFYNVKDFPGKRGLRKSPRVNLEWALMADGVPADQVYDTLSTPAGLERAFAMLDSIKGHVVWWESGAQPPQLLADGEVAMTSAYNGRLFNAVFEEGKNFQLVWDGQVWDLDLWVMPKGAPNKDAAWEFIKFSTDTKRLADQSNYISYGPVRKSSLPLVKKEYQPHMPTAPANFATALQNNYEWWADNNDEMNERFTAWLAK